MQWVEVAHVPLLQYCRRCEGRLYRFKLQRAFPQDDDGNVYHHYMVHDRCTTCGDIVWASDEASGYALSDIEQLFALWERGVLTPEAFDDQIRRAIQQSRVWREAGGAS